MKNVAPDLHTQLVLKLCLYWCEQSKYQMQKKSQEKQLIQFNNF